MNEKLLYQWTNEIAMHLPDLNTWQVENLGLFSYGVIQAESCQQDEVSRQVSGGEKVESTSRRWRRFLHNEHFPLETFFKDWSGITDKDLSFARELFKRLDHFLIV